MMKNDVMICIRLNNLAELQLFLKTVTQAVPQPNTPDVIYLEPPIKAKLIRRYLTDNSEVYDIEISS